MKKAAACVFLLLFTLGCAGGRLGPAETVSKYITDSLGGDYDNAYATLSDADRAYVSRAAYGEKAGEGNPFQDVFKKTTSFKIAETKELGDKAEVSVDFVTPSVEEYLPGILLGLLIEAKAGRGSIDVTERVKSSIIHGDIPKKSYSRVYDLVLEREAWKVFLNLRGVDEAARYKALGDDLFEEGDTAGAVRAYREAERANPRGPKIEQFIEDAKRRADKGT